MNKTAFSIIVFMAFSALPLGFSSPAWSAAPSDSGILAGDELIREKVRLEIGKRFPGTRIELKSQIQWTQASENSNGNEPNNNPGGEINSISLGDENGRGEVCFSVQSRGADGLRISWGRVSYAAFVAARVAIQRIMPGEALQPAQFTVQEIDVANGMNREIRGLILSPTAEIARIETRQTVLEGQPLLSSEIKRMPDVRRGDAIRIQLVSGSLTLSTLGTASEPGYLNESIHVMSQKTKRELVGTLLSDGIVEVRL